MTMLSTSRPAGTDAPELLLLPGTLCDERLFAPLTERLPGRRTMVADLTGLRSAQSLAERVLAQAPPTFALLGFSLGAIVAFEIAVLAPERVLGLAIIGGNARPVPAEDHGPRRATVGRAAALGARRHVGEDLWPRYVAVPAAKDVALRGLIEAMADTLGTGALESQTEVALGRRDMRGRLAALAMPALVLGGGEDVVATVEMHREIAALLPDADLAIVPNAGHFVLLEAPDIVAAHVAAWLGRTSSRSILAARPPHDEGGFMSDETVKPKPAVVKPADAVVDDPRAVLQVERRDFTQLVPGDRPRAQGMRGFDDCYTDIVDYIVRCTHKIWDERDVGLIYTHYTWNCVAYTTLGTMYDRETHIRDTIQRLVEYPERRGMALQVLWRGDDVDGFYTSHMTHGLGRHTQYGAFGKPTGRTFLTRTVADCMILENKIYKEWIVRDNMGPLVQLGIDPHAYALDLAKKKFAAGESLFDTAENRRLVGQYPPETEADISIAHDDGEAQLLRDLHHIYNKRMFGRIAELYSTNCQWHGPLMREFYGIPAVIQQTMRLVGLMSDCSFVPQHICAVESEQGGTKYAVRWIMEGHHFGHGSLGAPTGYPLFVMGISHFHVQDGKIIEEWAVYDELSMLVQLKLAALQAADA